MGPIGPQGDKGRAGEIVSLTDNILYGLSLM